MIPPDATPRERLWLDLHARAQRERLAGRWPPVRDIFRAALCWPDQKEDEDA